VIIYDYFFEFHLYILFFLAPFCSGARVTEAVGDWALLAQRRRGSAPGQDR
jgi:hypothetical protein